MLKLAKEKGNILAGLALSCFIFTLDVVNAEVPYKDEIVTVKVVSTDVKAKEPSGGTHKIQNLKLDTRIFDSQKEDLSVFGDDVPDGVGVCNSSNKTYMSYLKVTNTTSKQYWFLNSPECYTDRDTGIRMVGDRYCIAVGSYWAKDIGTKLNIIMKSGEVVKCIKGDAKADVNTDGTNRFHAVDGSVIEMIIDPAVFRGTHMYPEELNGGISRIEVVK